MPSGAALCLLIQLLACSATDCLVEIGRGAGVDLLLSSELSKVGSTWKLSMTVLDVAKSKPVQRLTRQTDNEKAVVSEAVAGAKQIVLVLDR